MALTMGEAMMTRMATVITTFMMKMGGLPGLESGPDPNGDVSIGCVSFCILMRQPWACIAVDVSRSHDSST